MDKVLPPPACRVEVTANTFRTEHDGRPEQIGRLVFDVETMPPYHPYPVSSSAPRLTTRGIAGQSPWIIGETEEVQHLIPFGDPETPRVIVGHNVSYDWQRIHEEDGLRGTQTRFMDETPQGKGGARDHARCRISTRIRG